MKFLTMSSTWRTPTMEDRGAYMSVAQVDDGNAELNAQGPTNGLLKNADEFDAELGNAPTPSELVTLPKVSDKLPWGAFLVAIVELCERFAYYGLSGPFQNYMANKYHDPNGLPGALGLAQSGATAFNNAFQLWCYVTPILGAVVADQYLGKYKTIKYFSIIYMVGILILFATSLPFSIERGGALPGLITAMVIIGIGTGGIKANVSPLIAEQVRSTKPFIKLLSNGRKVIVDPEVTVQRIYMMFYMCINVGSISAIATTMLELHVGFWSAYLLTFLMFCVGFFVLLNGKDKYVIKPPQGGVISNCFKALWIAMQNRFDLDQAKPSFQARGGRRGGVPWDDAFIDELKASLVACKVCLFFPIYWVTYGQMMNNFVSQAGTMQLHGLPNDILPNIDPVTIIIMIPVLDRYVYPFIRTRLHIPFRPIARMTCGFLVSASGMAYAAVLQSRIYASGPCYENPSHCEAGKIGENRYKPNNIHVAWQTPAYILIALSEILASVTGLELAYSKAPEGMKSFIMSLYLLTSAVGSALGILIAPFAKDPNLVWLYAGLACAAGVTGGFFYWTFKGTDEPKSGLENIELMGRKSEEDEEEEESATHA
ncbi:unnamed protein product [Periconia digitata]|uniref:Uncharacterized protein n=1 Tax=Periconia digitata TaxID=1303443 RepID=A0A9W4UHP0_9PLEO|nr:unnamed protein product [Periconia digitata]